MYYPYFYGRQAELVAVSDSSFRFGSPQKIWPLIEPVNANPRLGVWLGNLNTMGVGAYVIVNPHHGDLADPGPQATWAADFAGRLPGLLLVRPTLLETPSTTVADVTMFLAAYSGADLGIVLTTSKLNAISLAATIGSAPVTVFLRSGANALTYTAALGASNIAQISENFVALARNADYAGEEWLANNHQAFVSAGQKGSSDFTILPSTFVPGGGRAGAVAFHLTYEIAGGELWVQHFVSDETDRNVGTFQGKLLEAIAHLETQIALTPTRFDSLALDTYRDYYATGSSTSPSKNKSLQISHHLYTVGTYMGL